LSRIIPYSSSGRGPAILRNCLFGVWLLVFAFKQNSIYIASYSSEIILTVAGLFTIAFSLYDTYVRKEKNTVWGISTWILGVLLIGIGVIFYFF